MTADDLNLYMEFTAVLYGARHRFRVEEHMNIGPGWMCLSLDGPIANERGFRTSIHSSNQMTDFQPAAPAA